MERENRSVRVVPVGATALLTVFAVLCLTVFALLCLSDVRADARLADAALESVQAYYAADLQAQEILARLRDGQSVDGVEEVQFVDVADDGAWRHDTVCQYAVPISDTQELQVRVALPGGGEYTVLRWQAVTTVPWEGQDDLRVWTPD